MPKPLFTKLHKKFMSENRVLPRKELWEKFKSKFNYNISFKSFRAACKRFRFLTGRTGYFKKGHISWLTGTKGMVGPNTGQFKTGHLPVNHKLIGSERITDGYILIKTAEPKTWKHKHIAIWEKENGPVPEEYILSFKDGNFLHCEVNNLELITRSLQIRLNQLQYSSAPEEIKPSIRKVAVLQEKAGKLKSKGCI